MDFTGTLVLRDQSPGLDILIIRLLLSRLARLGDGEFGAVVQGHEIRLTRRHAKGRRAGYKRQLVTADERSDVRQPAAIARVTRHQSGQART